MGKKVTIKEEEQPVEDTEVTVVAEEPKAAEEPLTTAKPKKTLSHEQLEKLKIARLKARESQIKNTEKRKTERALAKENKELEEKSKLQVLQSKNEELKQKMPHQPKVEQEEEEPPPPKIPPHKKATRLPVNVNVSVNVSVNVTGTSFQPMRVYL